MRLHKPESKEFKIGKLLIDAGEMSVDEIMFSMGAATKNARTYVYRRLSQMRENNEISFLDEKYKIESGFRNYIEKLEKNDIAKPRTVTDRPLSKKYMVTAQGPRDEVYEERSILSAHALTNKMLGR